MSSLYACCGAASGALLLCDECDGFMHLSLAQKAHNRELLRLGATKVRYE